MVPFKIFLSSFTLVIVIEFFIFNEEILIVIAFSLFVYLISTYGSAMISSHLDERIIAIQHKFDMYANIQEKTIIHLLNYHSKRIALTTKIKAVSEIRNRRMVIINQFYKASLIKKTLAQIEEMLNRFILNEHIKRVSFQLRYAKQLQNIKLKLTGKKPTRPPLKGVILFTFIDKLFVLAKKPSEFINIREKPYGSPVKRKGIGAVLLDFLSREGVLKSRWLLNRFQITVYDIVCMVLLKYRHETSVYFIKGNSGVPGNPDKIMGVTMAIDWGVKDGAFYKDPDFGKLAALLKEVKQV